MKKTVKITLMFIILTIFVSSIYAAIASVSQVRTMKSTLDAFVAQYKRDPNYVVIPNTGGKKLSASQVRTLYNNLQNFIASYKREPNYLIIPGVADPVYLNLSQQRITQIAAMLPEVAAGFGKPYTNRAYWEDSVIKSKLLNISFTYEGVKYPNAISFAEALLTKTFPVLTDTQYIGYVNTFKSTGERATGEAFLKQHAAWLYPLVIAECIENKGRFVGKINEVLGRYADEKSWNWPAHYLVDQSITTCEIDLRSASFANDIAQALYVLDNKVTATVRTKVNNALQKKIFEPMNRYLKNGSGNPCLNGVNGGFWLTVNSNWNSVCFSGVVGTALIALPDRNDRAAYVAAAEYYGKNYLGSYNSDGYCTEGPAYWNYGFSYYMTLREQIAQATLKKLDLFSDAKVKNMATYGRNIQMINTLVPAYGDCSPTAKIDERLVTYCTRALNLGLIEKSQAIRTDTLTNALMDAFPNTAGAATSGTQENAIRTYFSASGVLISRPAAGTTCDLAVAIKACRNGNHAHNDVGTYVIALGTNVICGDPGGPTVYTADTFNSNRWTYPIMTSYGHPVPVVAGVKQRKSTDSAVQPKVISTSFTSTEDAVSYDITTAYSTSILKSLIRKMRYNRTGNGSVTIEDTFSYTTASPFETALVTNGNYIKTGANTVVFVSGKKYLTATITAPCGFTLVQESFNNFSTAFKRIGIRLNSNLLSGTVKVVFQP